MKAEVVADAAWKHLRRGCAVLAILMAATAAGANTNEFQTVTPTTVGPNTKEFQAIFATVPRKPWPHKNYPPSLDYIDRNFNIESLTQEKRDQLALAAAKSVAARDYPEALKAKTWRSPRGYSWETFAASLLATMSKLRLISTPEVIPYLTEGLRRAEGTSTWSKTSKWADSATK